MNDAGPFPAVYELDNNPVNQGLSGQPLLRTRETEQGKQKPWSGGLLTYPPTPLLSFAFPQELGAGFEKPWSGGLLATPQGFTFPQARRK
jgi:hypothetical protein